MNNTVRILVFGFLAMALSQVTGCAGGRQKQAVSVQPAPGSNSGQNGEEQGATPQGEPQPGVTQEGEEQNQSGNGEKTDLEIDAELDNGNGAATPGPATTPASGPWDGKSFKGSGKWKVAPVN